MPALTGAVRATAEVRAVSGRSKGDFLSTARKFVALCSVQTNAGVHRLAWLCQFFFLLPECAEEKIVWNFATAPSASAGDAVAESNDNTYCPVKETGRSLQLPASPRMISEWAAYRVRPLFLVISNMSVNERLARDNSVEGE